MTRKNLLTLCAASAAALFCTASAGVGVWAAAQDTLTTTDNIKFVADPWVDATVSDGTNTFTFVSTDTTDDNQTGTFVNIAQANWQPVTNSINKTAQIVLTIANTTTVDNNKLTYAVSNNWTNSTACTMAVVNSDADSKLSKNESATLTYTFTADGRYDFDVDVEWTVTLTATREK